MIRRTNHDLLPPLFAYTSKQVSRKVGRLMLVAAPNHTLLPIARLIIAELREAKPTLEIITAC